jgi:apolipoprotein N-acyltransferase
MVSAGLRFGKTAFMGLSLAISATFMALAIEAPQHFWLGWITLLPLLQAARVLSPPSAFGAGAFWGASLLTACAAMGSDSISFSLSSAAILTLGPALYACFGAILTRRVGFSPYLLALGWVGVEFCLRPVGLEHGLLAGTQGDGMLIRVAGSFAGYFLVAFLVAYINASLLSVLHKVTGSSTSLRRISSASGLMDRLISLDIPFIPSRVLCVSQPRAPPIR